jgi:hypothetical protein
MDLPGIVIFKALVGHEWLRFLGLWPLYVEGGTSSKFQILEI